MKRTLSLVLALLTVLASLAMLASCGGTDVENIQKSGKIVIGVTDYAPYDYEEGGKWVGFDADMARLLAEKLGVEAEFVLIDWDNKITELKSKKIDLIWNGMTVTDELAKELDFSNAYAQNAQVLVIKKDNAATYTSIDSLKGKKIVAEGGSTGEDTAKETFGEANVTGIQGQTKALFEVRSNTAEAAVVDYSIAKSLCGVGDYADLQMVEGVRIGEELFAVGARQGSDLTAMVNELFAEAYANGKMAELAEKYGKQDDGSNSIALCEIK